MLGKIVARVLALSLAFLLVACGGSDDSTPLAGGSGSVDGGGNGNNGDTPGEVVNVGSVQLLASPAQIDTAPGSTSTVQARVKDPNGILLEGVNVQFSVDNSGTLQVADPTTDASGSTTAILTADDNPGNRTVTVRASAGGASDSVAVQVSGTSISIAGPGSVALSDTAPFRITLTDGSGNGINNEEITVSANNSTLKPSNGTLVTNDGVVDVDLTAESSGTEELTVSAFSGESRVEASKAIQISPDSFAFITPNENTEVALNATQTPTIDWSVDGISVADGNQVRFTSTRGSLTPVNAAGTETAGRVDVSTVGGRASVQISSEIPGPATITATDLNSNLSTRRTIEFVATDAKSVNLQANKSQLDFGETTEIQAVVRDQDNNLVKDEFVTFSIVADNSNGTLSQSEGTTDSLGRVSTTYTAGNSNTARDGVSIRAKVDNVDDDRSPPVLLTVARRALRLVLGTGNELSEPDPTSYLKPYVAIVTDANGAPVEGAEVELSVLPLEYSKGRYVETVVVGGAPVWRSQTSVTCPSEDVNQNGILDPGENVNGSDPESLTPSNPATTSTSSVLTGSDGSVTFDLLYPQSVCSWVNVRLTGTVRVEGTESVESTDFTLSCLSEDLEDVTIDPPGGVTSPFGTGTSCQDTL